MVDSTVFECGLCTYPFDEFAHRPLSMPCGHVFCQQCLIHYYKGEALVCPLDLSRHLTDPYSLPSCYGILSHLPCKQEVLHCARHPSKKVKFLCSTHQQVLCSVCVLHHTGSGHSLASLNADLREVKTQLHTVLHQHQASLDLAKAALARLEASEHDFCVFNDEQLAKVNYAYDQAARTLHRNKKEALAALTRQRSEQLKVLERQKQRVKVSLEEHSRLVKELSQLNDNIKQRQYENVLARFKAEHWVLPETKIETTQVQYWGYREHLHISVGGMVRMFDKETKLLGRTKELKENTLNRTARSPGVKKGVGQDRVVKCRPKGAVRRHITRKRTHSV